MDLIGAVLQETVANTSNLIKCGAIGTIQAIYNQNGYITCDVVLKEYQQVKDKRLPAQLIPKVPVLRSGIVHKYTVGDNVLVLMCDGNIRDGFLNKNAVYPREMINLHQYTGAIIIGIVPNAPLPTQDSEGVAYANDREIFGIDGAYLVAKDGKLHLHNQEISQKDILDAVVDGLQEVVTKVFSDYHTAVKTQILAGQTAPTAPFDAIASALKASLSSEMTTLKEDMAKLFYK